MKSLNETEIFETLIDFAGLQSEVDVASFFNVDVNRLRYFIYMQPSKNYKTFVIRKASGKTRTIDAPNSYLKMLQKRLSEILYQIYNPRKCVKGFILEENIIKNAEVHLKKRFILNIDLENFFHSINFGRVRGLFLSEPFFFNEQVATLLAQVCCFKGRIPQGAPTSPIISNMICLRLDKHLMMFAGQHNLVYTRYADDITFSTRTNSFPTAVAFENDNGDIQLSDSLLKIFLENGFDINKEKLRLTAKFNRQEVTGLVVNKFVNVKRQYVRTLRAMIHCWQTKGYEEASNRFYSKYDLKGRNKHYRPEAFNKVVQGKLRFLKDVRGDDSKIYLDLLARAKKASPENFNVPLNQLEKLSEIFKDLKNFEYNGKKIKATTRGIHLETVLIQLFKTFEVPVIEAFRKSGKGEQVDGAFKFAGKHFLFECKWLKGSADHNDFDSLKNKISRASNMSYGFLLSINGFSNQSIDTLKKDREKTVIAMDGHDLEGILNQEYPLSELLSFKIDQFAFKGEPYVRLQKHIT